MRLWSQLARLGAAVAAFGPPVLAEADEEPDQVTVPTLGFTGQPVAEVVESSAVPPEPLEVEALGTGADQYIAALPADTAVPPAPNTQLPGPKRARGIEESRLHGSGRPGLRPWHGGGQRYGG